MEEDIHLSDHAESDDIDEMLDDFDVYDTERQLAFESLIQFLHRHWFHTRRARTYEQDLIATVSAGTGFMVQEAARLGAADYEYVYDHDKHGWNWKKSNDPNP